MATEWGTVIQAATSAFTAAFTGLSLWYLRRYTLTNEATYKAGQRALEESARPVLLLVRVIERGGERFAVFKNAGSGIAVDVSRTTNSGQIGSNDNVVAPRARIYIALPREMEDHTFEITYESLAGKKTLHHLLVHGRKKF